MSDLITKALMLSRRQDPMEILRSGGKRWFYFPALKERGLDHLYSSIDVNLKIGGRTEDPALLRDWSEFISLMPAEHSEYYFMYQVHSAKVEPVDEKGMGEKLLLGRRINHDDGPDGLMTSRRDFLLSSSFGDCAPLLFFDPVKGVQANVHSGWRGTLHNIGGVCVQRLGEVYGCRPDNILAAVGPHIGRDDFEVSEDVALLFKQSYPDIEGLVRPYPGKEAEGKYLVDLSLCICLRLLEAGLSEENILVCGRSTVAFPEDYHSYRRDKEQFGLMMVLSQMRG